MGASRRGGGACVRRRGRGRLPIPLPRAALSARREATAVGSFAGLCSGDFGGGGGASGTSALVSRARPAGPLGSEAGGRTRSRSTCRCRLTGAGGAWGRAGCRGVGWGGARGAGPWAGGSPGQCAGGWGRGLLPEPPGLGGGSWGQNRLAWGERTRVRVGRSLSREGRLFGVRNPHGRVRSRVVTGLTEEGF